MDPTPDPGFGPNFTARHVHFSRCLRSSGMFRPSEIAAMFWVVTSVFDPEQNNCASNFSTNTSIVSWMTLPASERAKNQMQLPRGGFPLSELERDRIRGQSDDYPDWVLAEGYNVHIDVIRVVQTVTQREVRKQLWLRLAESDKWPEWFDAIATMFFDSWFKPVPYNVWGSRNYPGHEAAGMQS